MDQIPSYTVSVEDPRGPIERSLDGRFLTFDVLVEFARHLDRLEIAVVELQREARIRNFLETVPKCNVCQRIIGPDEFDMTEAVQIEMDTLPNGDVHQRWIRKCPDCKEIPDAP